MIYVFYKIEYSDGVSEGENLDGTKNAYAYVSAPNNSKAVQVDNSLDDPASATYTSDAGELLRIRSGWADEIGREDASIMELDVQYIKDSM